MLSCLLMPRQAGDLQRRFLCTGNLATDEGVVKSHSKFKHHLLASQRACNACLRHIRAVQHPYRRCGYQVIVHCFERLARLILAAATATGAVAIALCISSVGRSNCNQLTIEKRLYAQPLSRSVHMHL